MDSAVLLVDFGSTYTKCVAVDLDRRRVIGQAQAPSTVGTDINVGLSRALEQVESETGRRRTEFAHRLACSSAAGGLRVVAVGLVHSLTVAAARQAALGAGARVVAAYGDRLSADELAEIVAHAPDLILLAGGVDGGDRAVILDNAARLAALPLAAPVVVAGNKEASPEAAALLHAAGKEAHVAPNVLPRLQQIAVEPARALIRQVYLEHIARAKGLEQAQEFVGRVIMPTPAAVLHAVQLLAAGQPGLPGWGSVLCVDIGGATTDVHSVAPDVCRPGVVRRGLPEPYARRTVEGDLGLRVSVPALLETAGAARLSDLWREARSPHERHAECKHEASRLESRETLRACTQGDIWPGDGVRGLAESIRRRAADVSYLPEGNDEAALDVALACACTEIGVERHVGRLREHHLPTGFCYLQEGKDLTQVGHVIGTGGVFRDDDAAQRILSGAVFSDGNPFLLKPQRPRLWTDRDYVMWAMGLLAQLAPDLALELLNAHLTVSEGGREGGSRSKRAFSRKDARAAKKTKRAAPRNIVSQRRKERKEKQKNVLSCPSLRSLRLCESIALSPCREGPLSWSERTKRGRE